MSATTGWVASRLLAEAGPGAIVVKTTSHRSRERLRAIVGPEPREMFSFTRAGGFYVIPEEHSNDVLRIAGITISRRIDDLHLCWGS